MRYIIIEKQYFTYWIYYVVIIKFYNGITKFTIFCFNKDFDKIKEESRYFKKIINEQDLCISEEEKVMSKMLPKQYIDSDFVYTNINNEGDVNDGI